MTGLPIRVPLLGGMEKMGKMAKNGMKIRKSTFLGENSVWEGVGGEVAWGDKPIFGVVEEVPPLQKILN